MGGDLNTRDSEIAEVGIPIDVKDLWATLDKQKGFQYTWDSTINTNIKISGRVKPRCRFDRAYFRPSASKNITPGYFGLCGMEKVTGLPCFPSDHWGIYCVF